MKLVDGINLLMHKELPNKFNDIVYTGNEVIKMTANGDSRNFNEIDVDMDTEVEYIKNRFEIQGEIEAVMVSFDVKKPRKRSFTRHQEYFRLL